MNKAYWQVPHWSDSNTRPVVGTTRLLGKSPTTRFLFTCSVLIPLTRARLEKTQ